MKKGNPSRSQRQRSCRELAVEILVKVEEREAYADLLLDHVLRKAVLSSADRALMTELVYGTLRWRGTIDWRLETLLRRPLSRLSSFLRNLLRITVYQVSFLSKIPPYAAVHEGVELAKRSAGKTMAGLVNAVLRNVIRQGENLPTPDLVREHARYLSVRWSHPEWLVKKWAAEFSPAECESLLKANNEKAPLVLRASLIKTDRDAALKELRLKEISAFPCRWSPQGVCLEGGVAVDEIPGFSQGLWQIQGEASQLVGFLLDPKPGERVLDACAAPGGKSTHLAELMKDTGQVVATDISMRGLEKIKQNVQRLDLNSVQCFCVDMTKGLAGTLAQPYDRILVDAPCSGLGTLRAHPEIKWRRTEKDIVRLSRLQKRILGQSAAYLKPGGILVYATCTLSQEENERVVEDFLEERSDFMLEDASPYLPGQARVMRSGSYFLALPHRHDTDGFFAARVRRVH